MRVHGTCASTAARSSAESVPLVNGSLTRANIALLWMRTRENYSRRTHAIARRDDERMREAEVRGHVARHDARGTRGDRVLARPSLVASDLELRWIDDLASKPRTVKRIAAELNSVAVRASLRSTIAIRGLGDPPPTPIRTEQPGQACDRGRVRTKCIASRKHRIPGALQRFAQCRAKGYTARALRVQPTKPSEPSRGGTRRGGRSSWAASKPPAVRASAALRARVRAVAPSRLAHGRKGLVSAASTRREARPRISA